MPKRFIFILGVFAFMLGVSFASLLLAPNLLGYVSIPSSLYFFSSFWKKSKKVLIVFLICLMLGCLRIVMSFPAIDSGHIAFYVGLIDKVKVIGSVIAEPTVKADKTYLKLAVSSLMVRNHTFTVSGNLLVQVPSYPEFAYGTSLSIDGWLAAPQDFDNFNYKAYLAKDNIYTVMYADNVLYTSQNGSHFFHGASMTFMKIIYDIKSRLLLTFNEIMPEPASSIMAGLLLGIRKSLDETVVDNFNKVGLTHILAISGYNIVLIMNFLGLVLKNFIHTTRFGLITIVLLFFCIVTGLSASIVRAGLMGFLMMLAAQLGRPSYPLTNLMLSASIMVMMQPLILNFDLSFQLSFFATLGLLMVLPLSEKYFVKFPAVVGDALAVTLSAQVFTLPIILFHFGRLSLIAPLANLFILPCIPMVMMLGLGALIFALAAWPLGVTIGGLSWVFISILLRIVEIMAGLPLAFIDLGIFPAWLGVFYYMIIFIFFRKSKWAQNYF